MSHTAVIRAGIAGLLLALLALRSATVQSDPVFFAGAPPSIAQVPLYMRDSVSPLNMLVMGKDHKIYYEAYNDASDLDGDGNVDVGYQGWRLKTGEIPEGESRYAIDYYGYFNSYACYSWQTDKFIPVSAAPNKTCSGYWSGDFLNYLTMSRMDALRRVLYGGWRQVDSETETVLQGAFFPQDAHSWGKEYQSVDRDGYDIRNYAPLPIPASGRYHLFAVTTLTGNNATFPNYQAPTFRVLRDSPYRVWNWLSIEGPVAGLRCFNASNSRVDCVSGGATQPHPGHPGSRAAFDTMVENFAIPENRFGGGAVSAINCNNSNCNPFGTNDNYLTLIEGQFYIPGGWYQFQVDGDDVIDLQVRRSNGTVVAVAGCYTTAGRGFGTCGGNEKSSVFDYSAGTYNFTFRQEEGSGGDGYRLRFRSCDSQRESSCGSWLNVSSDTGSVRLRNAAINTYNLTPTRGGSTRTDYLVRVQTCPTDDPALRDLTCKAYPGGTHKPTGILHDYGENQKMYFGLITGSQANNLEGGVLRRNISNFAEEVDPQTGIFRGSVEGIVRSIDRLRMIGGGYNSGIDNSNSDSNWNWANGTGNCVSQGARALNNGECRMWGNPLAEMMFEGLRYFAGAAGATARFATGGSSEGRTEDASLGLATPAWQDPYAPDGLNYPSCSRPVMTVISDINPSYDGQLPGSAFDTYGADAAVPGFNAANQGQAIWNDEFGAGAREVFVGEVLGTATDGAPTAKTATSFGTIRGLAPEEPTKGGTYYSASVARYGSRTQLNARAEDQFLTTYSIALASPLPRISFPTSNGTVELLPFAKTVSGTFGDGTRKPTNTIVDFYVEEIVNFPDQPGDPDPTVNDGYPYAAFRINYEDVEQGNDHDMDAIVRYEVRARANGTIDVQLTSEYAAGSANHAIGYTMSGTTKDGIYLEVCDLRNGVANDGTRNSCAHQSYYAFNTPPGRDPGYCSTNQAGCGGLPPTTTRTFIPSSAGSAAGDTLRDPLWYAAKYGDPTGINLDANGEPANYFPVTNPLNLRAQLEQAFDSASGLGLDVGSATLSGARVGSASFTLQPSFSRSRNGNDWTGNLSAIAIKPDGTLGTTLWNAQKELPAPGGRRIFTITAPGDGTSNTGSGRTVAVFSTAMPGSDADRLAMLGIPSNEAIMRDRYGGVYSADEFIEYLRGNDADETSNGGTLRERSGAIGSIINSEPVVSTARADFGYGSYSHSMFDGYANTGSSGYLHEKRNRPTMAYVGANDGMLHAFNADTVPCGGTGPDANLPCAGSDAGKEVFAFIPHGVLGKMGRLALPDDEYEHEYYVDGQLAVGDAKDGTTWKTVLVGSTGGGGRSVFALDVTDPTINESRVLWERNSAVDNDVGYIYGKPLIVPLENGRWGAVFGNGYGGNTSDPSLYILDVFTGQLIRKITADDGNQAGTSTTPISNWACSTLGILCARSNHPFNGLGQITAIDRDGDGRVDRVYGGDLQGNLWKFDLSAGDAAAWNVANDGEPLFTAELDGERQPITGGIRVSAGPGTGVMVFFGTGRYLFTGDNDVPADPQLQSLYGIFDNGSVVENGRDDLVRQSITSQSITADGQLVRNISRTAVTYYGGAASRGWYIDLAVESDGATPGLEAIGERFIATPRIQSGRVFFTTYTPVENSCDPGGMNFVYGLDLLSGAGALSNLSVLPSDSPICSDGECGAVSIDNAGGSGGEGGEGSASPPVTNSSALAVNPVKTVPGCTGSDCPTFEECQVVIYPGAFVLPRPCGRQSWRQLK